MYHVQFTMYNFCIAQQTKASTYFRWETLISIDKKNTKFMPSRHHHSKLMTLKIAKNYSFRAFFHLLYIFLLHIIIFRYFQKNIRFATKLQIIVCNFALRKSETGEVLRTLSLERSPPPSPPSGRDFRLYFKSRMTITTNKKNLQQQQIKG